MTEIQKDKLKSAGFRRYEISHYKAGRFDKIARNRLKEIVKIIEPKAKKDINKPLVITQNGVTLKKSKNIIIIR